MTEYYVYYGQDEYPFEIPPGWTVVRNVVPKEPETALSIPELVERALLAPQSTRRLSESVHEGSTVALIVDDWTRSTPINQILPTLLRELQAGGAKSENIQIVVALGTHSSMPQDAVIERVGETVFRQYQVSQHDCRAEHLIPVGHLSTGGEVRINPIVVQADVKIGVGSILPHHINGFGGGAKIIMPGVSSFGAVREHHLHYTLQPDCYIGNLEANPAYEESCQVASVVRLDFIVNCIYNSRAEVVDVVAGDFQQAHRVGVQRSKQNYAFHLEEPADLTITSAYPYLEAPQTLKPVIPASLLATRPGGSVIVMAASRGRLSESMLAAFDDVYSGNSKQEADSFFSPALIYIPACVAHNSVTMVSSDLDAGSVARLGFRHACCLEEAIERERKLRPQARVNILPAGGLVLPLLKKPVTKQQQ